MLVKVQAFSNGSFKILESTELICFPGRSPCLYKDKCVFGVTVGSAGSIGPLNLVDSALVAGL